MVGCLKFQQRVCVSQGRICSDKCTCCPTETEIADQTCSLAQSQYTDTGPAGPSADLTYGGSVAAWLPEYQCLSHWYDSTWKKPEGKAGIKHSAVSIPLVAI